MQEGGITPNPPLQIQTAARTGRAESAAGRLGPPSVAVNRGKGDLQKGISQPIGVRPRSSLLVVYRDRLGTRHGLAGHMVTHTHTHRERARERRDARTCWKARSSWWALAAWSDLSKTSSTKETPGSDGSAARLRALPLPLRRLASGVCARQLRQLRKHLSFVCVLYVFNQGGGVVGEPPPRRGRVQWDNGGQRALVAGSGFDQARWTDPMHGPLPPHSIRTTRMQQELVTVR